MSKTERQSAVVALTERLKGSANLYVTDFSGLTVERMTDFRRRLRAVGAGYVVVKNTLAVRALAAGSISALDGKLFKGPIGVVLAGNDPLPAAKVIGEFAKLHQKPEVRAGLVDVLTTLATRSPLRLSRVTTWNSLAGGAGWSYSCCSTPSR